LPDGKEWAFWQYANRGRLYGIEGFVDFNVFSGSPEEFLEFVSSGK
jgi:lysozyme